MNEEWKKILKTERNLDIGSTNYAKDEGDSIYFIQWNDDRLNPRIPKTELNAILDEYEQFTGKPITDIRLITSKSRQNENFVDWYNKSRGIGGANVEQGRYD